MEGYNMKEQGIGRGPSTQLGVPRPATQVDVINDRLTNHLGHIQPMRGAFPQLPIRYSGMRRRRLMKGMVEIIQFRRRRPI